MSDNDMFMPLLDEGNLPVPSRKRNVPSPDADSDESGGEQDEAKGFRFSARSAFITYPRCPVTPSEYFRYVEFKSDLVKSCFGKQEHHADGSLHLHMYIAFHKKHDSHNCRHFDITVPVDGKDPTVYHGNIKNSRGKGSIVGIWEYLCKNGGVPPTDVIGHTELYPVSKNFRKDFGDRTQWLNYLSVSGMPLPRYPITLPDGVHIETPQAGDKKRHYWIHGPANSGKTYWLERNIYCFRNYKVAESKYPFDDYINETIIVYDDISPIASHLLSLANSSEHPRTVPGETRYHRRSIPAGTVTLIIVCNNQMIDDYFEKESGSVKNALHARFNEIALEERFD
jgi:hypothetical protein